MFFEIKIKPGAQRQIDNLRRRAEDMWLELGYRDEPLKKIKKRQIARWATNFDGQGRIYGKWPALSPKWTIPERAAQGYGAGPILIREGYLRTHFVDQNEDGTVSNDAVNWNFTNTPGAYTVSHHEGYDNPIAGRAPIQSRVLWDLNADDEEAAKRIMESWVSSVIKKYF